MNKRIHIGTIYPNELDATSWYRGSGPFGHMQRHYDVQIYPLRELNSATAQGLDCVFLQRPAEQIAVDAITFLKKMGVPTIIDYDDLLTGVPSDNQSSVIYGKPETQKAVTECLDKADAIIVSTAELKRQFERLIDSKKITVVNNALDERYFHSSKSGTMKSCLWRGGMTHERELREFTPGIQAGPQIPMRYFGYNPYWLTEEGSRHVFVGGWINPTDFYDNFNLESSQVGIVPLKDNPFNKCKSNIAALEMIWAGAIPLVPDWEEWKLEGVVGYKNSDMFTSQLNELCSMPKTWYPEQHAKAWKCVQDRFMLKNVNYARWEVIANLVHKA